MHNRLILQQLSSEKHKGLTLMVSFIFMKPPDTQAGDYRATLILQMSAHLSLRAGWSWDHALLHCTTVHSHIYALPRVDTHTHIDKHTDLIKHTYTHTHSYTQHTYKHSHSLQTYAFKHTHTNTHADAHTVCTKAYHSRHKYRITVYTFP